MAFSEAWFPSWDSGHFNPPACPSTEVAYHISLIYQLAGDAYLTELGTVSIATCQPDEKYLGTVVLPSSNLGSVAGLVLDGACAGLLVVPNVDSGVIVRRGVLNRPSRFDPETAHQSVDRHIADSTLGVDLHGLIDAVGVQRSMTFPQYLVTLLGMNGIARNEAEFLEHSAQYNLQFNTAFY